MYPSSITNYLLKEKGTNLLFLLMINILSSIPVCAQKLSNVKCNQIGKIINISYDLEGLAEDQKSKISVYLSTDGGYTYGNNLQKITGDCGGNISPGKNKLIYWDVLSEQESLISDNVVIRLQCDLIAPDKKIKKRSYGEFEYEMVFVRGGTFQMGSNIGHRDEKPVHP